MIAGKRNFSIELPCTHYQLKKMKRNCVPWKPDLNQCSSAVHFIRVLNYGSHCSYSRCLKLKFQGYTTASSGMTLSKHQQVLFYYNGLIYKSVKLPYSRRSQRYQSRCHRPTVSLSVQHNLTLCPPLLSPQNTQQAYSRAYSLRHFCSRTISVYPGCPTCAFPMSGVWGSSNTNLATKLVYKPQGSP